MEEESRSNTHVSLHVYDGDVPPSITMFRSGDGSLMASIDANADCSAYSIYFRSSSSLRRYAAIFAEAADRFDAANGDHARPMSCEGVASDG